MVPVDEIHERLEADVGHVLLSPRPKGGEWVTKMRGFGRPTRPRQRILTESARARRRIWRSVYWLGPPE